MLYFGTTKLKSMYLGTTKIIKAYLGNDLVFNQSAPPAENLYKFSDMESGSISSGQDIDSPTSCRTKFSNIITAQGLASYTITSPYAGFVVSYANFGGSWQWLAAPAFGANTPTTFTVPVVANGMRVVVSQPLIVVSGANITLYKI